MLWLTKTLFTGALIVSLRLESDYPKLKNSLENLDFDKINKKELPLFHKIIKEEVLKENDLLSKMLKHCKMKNEKDMVDLVFKILYLYVNNFEYKELLKGNISSDGIVGML